MTWRRSFSPQGVNFLCMSVLLEETPCKPIPCSLSVLLLGQEKRRDGDILFFSLLLDRPEHVIRGNYS